MVEHVVISYLPEDLLKAARVNDDHLQDDGLSLDGQDAEFLCNEEEDDGKNQLSGPNSPLSTGTNPDAGYGSPCSNASDQLAESKTSSKEGQAQEQVNTAHLSLALKDSLAYMKAIYANLTSDTSWSSIAMDILKTKQVSANGSSSSNTNHHINNSSSNASSITTTNANTNSSSSRTKATTTTTTNANTNSNSSASNGGGIVYDWHQAVLAKTLQHTPYHFLPQPSLFSTVQLYRQNKLYGPVFTGASKFCCKDCSAAYDTLVGLTVHMNETGHYRDDNKDKEDDKGKRWSKPRKRSLMEMEGKEDAQKVLKCMYCGHSFESLQDLSVHMIKTKHYQKVPLKDPMPALSSKLVPSTKKQAFQDLEYPCSPDPLSSMPSMDLGEIAKDQKVANPYVTANNRYGYQNGTSYTWQFEACKSWIFKCMECGSSHDTLQQLTAHMMVTGHFLKVINSASKKGKQVVLDPVVEEKIQSIPLLPTTNRLPISSIRSLPSSPANSHGSEEKREMEEEITEGSELEK
ncbi:hypothetical protein MATL_G00236600 [Megalops atlanticus]|uniref:C2H2-type domain-containing protein n=1 Tax=Megalops atlanticus TaxID=7932 RepID=A0A9D3PEI6_MEGAT|nr:hypothetical protein MATL_G00236600 [Megalops atlanticus]